MGKKSLKQILNAQKRVTEAMNDKAEWGEWDCPVCGSSHDDPDYILETTCKNGHYVRLGAVNKYGYRIVIND